MTQRQCWAFLLAMGVALFVSSEFTEVWAQDAETISREGKVVGKVLLGIIGLFLFGSACWSLVRGLNKGREEGGWNYFLGSAAMAGISILLFIFILKWGGHNPTEILDQVKIE